MYKSALSSGKRAGEDAECNYLGVADGPQNEFLEASFDYMTGVSVWTGPNEFQTTKYVKVCTPQNSTLVEDPLQNPLK